MERLGNVVPDPVLIFVVLIAVMMAITARRAERKGMGMSPTLTLFRGDPDLLDQVRDFARLGGEVLFGTYLPDLITRPSTG